MKLLNYLLIASLICFTSASATRQIKCLDWDGKCNALVFVNTTYPRPDVAVGMAVALDAYNEESMKKVLALVLGDFIANGLAPWNTFVFMGNLPPTFPGMPDLKLRDYRREYYCTGVAGCRDSGARTFEAFSMGYHADGLSSADAQAVMRYVHNETGGRLNHTLDKACDDADFDRTCPASTPPPLSSPPAIDRVSLIIGGVFVVTAITITAPLLFVGCKKYGPCAQPSQDDAELLPLVRRQ